MKYVLIIEGTRGTIFWKKKNKEGIQICHILDMYGVKDKIKKREIERWARS